MVFADVPLALAACPGRARQVALGPDVGVTRAAPDGGYRSDSDATPPDAPQSEGLDGSAPDAVDSDPSLDGPYAPDGECYRLHDASPESSLRGGYWLDDPPRCGPGCMQVGRIQPGQDAFIGEHDGKIEWGNNAYLASYHPGTDRSLERWIVPLAGGPSIGLCSGGKSVLGSYSLVGDVAVIACSGAYDEVHPLDLRTNDDCVRLRSPLQLSGTPPMDHFGVRGTITWLASPYDGPRDVYVLDDGSATPRRLTHGGCANVMSAHDDFIAYVVQDDFARGSV